MNCLLTALRCEFCGEEMVVLGDVLACTNKECKDNGVKYQIPTVKILRAQEEVVEVKRVVVVKDIKTGRKSPLKKTPAKKKGVKNG